MTRRADPEQKKRDNAVREVLLANDGAEMATWRIVMNARIKCKVEMTEKQAAAAAARIGAQLVRQEYRQRVWKMEPQRTQA